MTFEDSSFEDFDPITYAAESRGRSSDEIRAELGQLASAAGASSIPHLAQLALTNDPKLAVAAIEALGRIREKAAADALFDISNKVELKDVRKRAKAMLFQLHSWGIDPSQPVEDERARDVPGMTSELVDAWVSLPDSWGRRVIFAYVRHRFESRIMSFLLEEEHGITNAMTERSSRKEFDEWVEDYFRKSNIDYMRIDLNYMAFLIQEALDRMRSTGFPIIPEVKRVVDLWDKVIKNRETKYLEPPIYNELKKEEIEQDEDLSLRARDLVSLKEVQYWFTAIRGIDDYISRLSSVFDGIIQVSRFVQAEMVQRVVQDAIEATFGGERRLLFARRLEDLSYYLLHKGREQEAREALSVALDLRRDRELHRIPFIVEFIHQGLGIGKAGQIQTRNSKEGKAGEGLLIINPFDPKYRKQNM